MSATLIPVADPCDPRLAAYRHVRERDLVGREGAFVAEGKVVMASLLDASGFTLDSALILESRLQGMKPLLEAARPDFPAYVVPRPVFDGVAGFHVHRGIMAIGRRISDPRPQRILEGLTAPSVVICSIGLTNHDNVGALFRNAAAFGAAAIMLDGQSCDPLYRKAIRVSTGSVFRVPFVRGGTAAEILSLLVGHGFEPLALSPRGEEELGPAPAGHRIALLVGTEGEGLPRDILATVRSARITLSPGVDSLNVATAAAVALDRLRR